MSAIPCRECTQSTDARCTAAALQATFTGPGIVAAYCNDQSAPVRVARGTLCPGTREYSHRLLLLTIVIAAKI